MRFENANSKPSSLTNSALHNGFSWAITVKSSANILIQNNMIYNFRPVGINIGMSKNIKVDGNVVA